MYAELIEKENNMDIDTLRQLQAEHRSEIAEAERLHPGLVMPWENPAWATIAAAAPTLLADLITALEREAKLRDLHKRVKIQGSDGFGGLKTLGYECDICGPANDITLVYPCPTIRILDGNE